jgi:hypothetical protein
MSGSEPVAVVRQGWDGPSYRVRREAFETWFLVGVDEDLKSVANVDVDVRLADGSLWGATILTLAEVAFFDGQVVAHRGGVERPVFWCVNQLIVRDAGIDNMVAESCGSPRAHGLGQPPRVGRIGHGAFHHGGVGADPVGAQQFLLGPTSSKGVLGVSSRANAVLMGKIGVMSSVLLDVRFARHHRPRRSRGRFSA